MFLILVIRALALAVSMAAETGHADECPDVQVPCGLSCQKKEADKETRDSASLLQRNYDQVESGQLQVSELQSFYGRRILSMHTKDDDNMPVILQPPSDTQALNITKKEPHEGYSQCNQDMVLKPILSQIPGGFFLESGAADGEEGSNTLYYEVNHGWTGLLVEPDPHAFATLVSKHRNVYAVEGCLSPTDHAMDLHFHVDGQMSKIIDNDISLATEDVTVKAVPLHNIMQNINRKTIDFWSLDIEGSEGAVLEATDFSKVEIGVMLIEMNKNEENNAKIQKVLSREGFNRIGKTIIDNIFVNPNYFQKRSLPVPTGDVLDEFWQHHCVRGDVYDER